MFSFLTPYKLAIQIGGIVLVVSAALFGLHRFKTSQQQIGYDKAVKEFTVVQLKAEQANRMKEQALYNQIEKARDEATLRNQQIDQLSRTTTTTVNSLRNTIASLRNNLSKNSGDTNRHTADTALEVLGECAKEYRDLAEKTDRHVTDLILLQKAYSGS